MFAIAVIVCTLLLSRDVKAQGLKSELISDLAFWIVLGGILGARCFFIILNWPHFIDNPLEIIMIQKGGLAWQGGLVVGTITALFFFKKNKLSILPMLDLFAPYIALGEAIGRVGCFLNGCCYGKPVAWGIYFPVHHDRLHPTQLYLMAGLALVFFILKNYQKKVKVPGEVFALYLFLGPMVRFLVEFFRADHVELLFGLSIFQFVCLGLGVAAYIFHRYLHIKKGPLEMR